MKQHELFRASSVMAVGTILSRITGFIGSIIVIATLPDPPPSLPEGISLNDKSPLASVITIFCVPVVGGALNDVDRFDTLILPEISNDFCGLG